MGSRIVPFLVLLLWPVHAASQTVIIKTDTGASASGQASTTETAPETKAEPESAETSTPQQVSQARGTYEGTLSVGHGLYLRGAHQAALARYEEAKQMKPGDPLVYYFIGCAKARLARYDEALVSLKTATTIAGDKDQVTHGKALFMMAQLEEMRRRDDAAVEAWKTYKGYAQTHTSVATFPSTATKRLEAYEAKRKLYEEYKVVRERIADSQ